MRAALKECRTSEKTYADLYDNAPDMFVSVNARTGRIERCNTTTSRTLGYPRDELMGRPVFELYHPSCREMAREAFRRFIDTGEIGEIELQICTKNGRTIDVSLKAVAVRDNDGRILYSRSIWRDITSRKNLEREMQRTNRALLAFSWCNQALLASKDECQLLHDICRIIVEKCGYRMAWIGFAENDELKTVRPVAQAGFTHGYLENIHISWDESMQGQGPTGMAIRTGRPCSARHIATDPAFAPWRAEALKRGYGSSLALPLRNQETIFGSLNIYAPEPEAFDLKEKTMLVELAGTLSYGITSLREQAELAKVSQELRENRHFLQQVLDTEPGSVYIYDLEERRNVYINRHWLNTFEYSEEETINMGDRLLAAIFHPDDLERIASHHSNWRHAKDGETRKIEYRIKDKNGHWHWLRSRETVFCRNSTGRVRQILGVAHDITDHRKAEQVLIEKKKLLKDMGRMAHVGGWEFDPLTHEGTWTEEVAKIHDLDPAMKPNMALGLSFFHGQHRDQLEQAIREAIEHGTPYDLELEMVSAKGCRKWIRTIGEPIRDGERTLRVRGSLQDITERKRSEEEIRKLNTELEQRVARRTLELTEANTKLRELDRLKSMFIASMSHELRTPLNSIIGFSSILREEWLGPLTEEQKENLTVILMAGKHLLELINDVIDLSKIEAGMLEAQPESFALPDVVNEAVKTVKQDAGAKGLRISAEAESLLLFTDRRRLLQCLLNLLSNAVKFSDAGTGTITVIARKYGAGELPDQAVITVTDTGIGIREEDAPKLFNPFVRLHSPGETNFPGTGLGLYLTGKLIREVLGGEIRLDSKFRQGSTFTLIFPLRLTVKKEPA